MRMDVVPLQYRTIAHMFHLMKYLFKFDTEINFRCAGVMWWIVALFLWVSIWTVATIHMYMDYTLS